MRPKRLRTAGQNERRRGHERIAGKVDSKAGSETGYGVGQGAPRRAGAKPVPPSQEALDGGVSSGAGRGVSRLMAKRGLACLMCGGLRGEHATGCSGRRQLEKRKRPMSQAERDAWMRSVAQGCAEVRGDA